MKLLKLLLFIFAVYFIRRFIQLYKVMKQVQENQLKAQSRQEQPWPAKPSSGVIDVEYKVIDS